MAIVPTPASAKPIPDFDAGTFDGSSLLFQSRNGDPAKVSGDDVAAYVAVNKVYTGLSNKTIPQAIAAAAGVEVTGTLTAGATSLTLSDASITSSSTLEVFTDIFGAWLENMVVSTGSVVLTFESQSADMSVKVRVS